MITFSVQSHNDYGSRIVFKEVPFWRDTIDLIVGKYNPRWGWDYRLWNRIIGWTHKKDKALHYIPIDDLCLFEQKVYGNKDCWIENCTSCTQK